jgi:hypothetical protein
VSVHFVDDPLRIVARAFRTLYPGKSARIVIQPLTDKLGEAAFAPGRVPLVSLCPTQSYVGCIDILAHELAHVATVGNGHGKEWRKAYNRIRAEYIRIVRQRTKGRTVVVSINDGRVRNRRASKERTSE